MEVVRPQTTTRAETVERRAAPIRTRKLPRVTLQQAGPKVWVLDDDYVAPSLTQGEPDVVVPKGFTCDGASIPRILWAWSPPTGLALRAAVIHDWRYWTHDPPDRLFADREFLVNLRDSGMRRTQAWLHFVGLRLGGWITWAKGKAEIHRGERPKVKTLEVAAARGAEVFE